MKNRKGFWQGALCGALAIILITGLVSCGMAAGILKDDTEKKLKKIKYLVDEYYLDEYTEEDLEAGLLEGYVSGLDDPYSVYYDEEETKALMESVQGEYSGVGAVLTQNIDTGVITILRVYENSPAMKAGLQDGDVLYKVGDIEVTGEDLSEIVTHIKGEKGTEVELTVYREGVEEAITVTAVRDKIEIETVTYEMLGDDVGYIAVSEFEEKTFGQYKKAIEALNAKGMKGLIVDLRNNPGGSLSAVCEMADYMVPEGLVVYTEDKNGEKTEYKSTAQDVFDKPLVVLVNGNSASASEIFAGAIQDHKIGMIVGTQTYGKGVVQSIYDLKDGTCVKLTVSEYFTPNGRTIHKEGVTPDVVIEYKYDEKNPSKDNQRDKAVEIIKDELR